jgi:tripartite-type tricarboxylate transporter receptor subunit TctC
VDVLARAFFAAFSRLSPETTFHIQTISGGAGAAALEELAKADSNLITVSIFGNGPIYSQLLATEELPFDISKLEWLGSIADNRRVLTMRKALGPATFETLLKLGRQPVTPSTGAGAPNHIESLLINAITGLHLKVVPGFEDAQIDTMLLAGDADVRLGGVLQVRDMIKTGELVPVLRMGDGTYPAALQSLPKLADVARPGVAKELILLLETLNRLGRPYVAAPGTDPAIVAALRAAFPKVIEDREFQEILVKQDLNGGSTPGDEIQAAMTALFSNPALKSIIRHYSDCGTAMSEDPAATCD